MGQGGRDFTFQSSFLPYLFLKNNRLRNINHLEDRIFEARGLVGLARLLGLLEGG